MKSDLTNIMNNVRALIQPLIEKPSSSGSKKIIIENNEIYLETSIGSIRDANQDKISFAVIDNQVSIGAQLAVAVLADGMGGMIEGDKAASIAISSFISYIATGHSDKGLKNIALKAVNHSNEEVFRNFNGKGGTTLSAIVFGKNGCVAVNVGDSRIYYLNRTSGIKQLGVDDTIAGQLKKEDEHADNWLYPTQGDHRLAQYVGMGDGIDVHCIDLSEYHKQKDIEAGFLLTSDGAHYLGNIMLNQIVLKSETKGDIPVRIGKTSAWLSGHDNISAILLPTFFDFEEVNKKLSDLCLNFYSVSYETSFVIPTKNYQFFSNDNKSQIKMNNTDEISLLEEIDLKIAKAKEEIKEEIINEMKMLIEETKTRKKKTIKKVKNIEKTNDETKKNEDNKNEDSQLTVDIISIGEKQMGWGNYK
ncbi:MAG: hypothetical protein GY749_25640 [Desulfobacteraceae bacterium]|nr:hypothetical protein [Desulfobacteraceae bacterium]